MNLGCPNCKKQIELEKVQWGYRGYCRMCQYAFMIQTGVTKND